MTDSSLLQEIADLFIKSGKAHHQAFIETDGDDPEWPLWYADHMHADLSKLLSANFTKSELVFLLVLLSKEQPLRAPGADWPLYYAKFLAERYV